MEPFTILNYINSICEDFDNPLIPWDVKRPSESDVITRDDEDNIRAFCCELIQESGIMLRLPQITISKAMETLHRLLYKINFSFIDFRMVSAACLFIAAKFMDTPKKLRDMVSVFDYLILSKEGAVRPIEVLDLSSHKCISLINGLIEAERFVLKEIGFSLSYKLPYIYLSSYLAVMHANKTVSQKAWNFVNDSYRTVACVCFPPHTIACAAIYYAAKYSDTSFPDINWWEIFDTHLEDIREIGSEVIAIYGARRRVEIDYMYRMMRKCNVDASIMFDSSFGNGPPRIVAPAVKEMKVSNRVTPSSSLSKSRSKSRSRSDSRNKRNKHASQRHHHNHHNHHHSKHGR